MGRSRYANTPIIDGKFFASYSLPKVPGGISTVDLLQGVKTKEYVYKAGDRLDHVAARMLGDDSYWWVIALVNGINYPFASGGLVPGRTLLVPANVQDVLNKLLR